MRKILPSILILLVIVNIFAPFSVRIDKNKLSLKKNIADAAIMDVQVNQTGASDSVIDLEFNIHRQISDYRGVFYTLTKTEKTTLNPGKIQIGQNNLKTLNELVDQGLAQTYLNSVNQIFVPGPGDQLLYDLKIENDLFTSPAETTGADGNTYKDFKVKKYLTGLQPDTEYWLSVWGFNGDAAPRAISVSLNKRVHTAPKDTRDDNQYEVTSINTTGPDSALPQCWISITQGWSMSGCIAQFIYYFFFVPTSFLFALTGVFFDWTFHYTIQDSSYSSSFVVEGWGVVRDFCNIFFIFVLLYIAFREILGFSGGHGPNTKQLIINVIIIGLLINFSLFAAQLVIDSSNILARVFYNSNSIKITKNGANGVTNSTPQLNPGPNGELQLSAALVNKVNPQNLIIEAKKVGNIKDEAGKSNQTIQSNTGVSNGTFILVTILAIAVNIVGLIVFLSIGLMCISRVVGLWIYMILAPLAFFSYTIPQMQGLKVIGWKNWWSQLMCMSFWAPLLIFFMYLILKFLETGFDLLGAQNKDGLQFVIAVIVPFAFIMTLLWRAKDLAKTMGCEIATKITGGVAAVGGLALGGAALGAAFAGRNILGRGMAAMSKTDGAKAMVKYRQDLKDYNSGKTNVAPVKPKINFISKIGDTLNRKQEKVNEVDHARHEMDSIKDKAGLKGVDDHNLSGVDVQKMQTTFTKEKKSEIESDIRKGASPLVDATGQPIKDTNGNVITGGESGYKSAMRNQVYTSMNINQNTATDSEKKKVEDELNIRFNAVLKTSTDKESANRFNHLRDESKQKVNPYDRVVARSNKGSYDIRNLSQTKVDKREGIFTRMGAGLIAGVAMGVRTGLKNSNINHGSGQSDILKDLGHTITEALKSAQFNVKVESSHGKSSDDHGGGGHH